MPDGAQLAVDATPLSRAAFRSPAQNDGKNVIPTRNSSVFAVADSETKGGVEPKKTEKLRFSPAHAIGWRTACFAGGLLAPEPSRLPARRVQTFAIPE